MPIQIFNYIIVAIMGLLIGSFLNVCIYRIPRKESIAFPPSHCFSCEHQLGVLDLFPVLSYVLLRGKCRYCKSPVSIQYPIIEILNSLVYLLLFSKFGVGMHFLFYAPLASTLIVVSLIDYYHQIIPNETVLVCIVLGIALKLVQIIILKEDISIAIDSLIGFLVGRGVYLFIFIISGGNMGGGDIKLMSALGIWLGWKHTLFAIFLTFIIGALVSVFLIATKIKGRKDRIPFGPFIVIGTFIMLIYGAEVIDLYIKLM